MCLTVEHAHCDPPAQRRSEGAPVSDHIHITNKQDERHKRIPLFGNATIITRLFFRFFIFFFLTSYHVVSVRRSVIIVGSATSVRW